MQKQVFFHILNEVYSTKYAFLFDHLLSFLR